MSKKTIHILTALCSLFICSYSTETLRAQAFAAKPEENFHIHFLKDSVEVEENEFEFNNISIRYEGASLVTVQAKYLPPSFVNVISSPVNNFDIPAHQQQIIPIRFNSIKNSLSDKWSPFTVSLLINGTGQTIEHRFWIKQKPFTKWKCFLQQPDLVLKEHEQKNDFFIQLENTGTTDDEYAVEVDSELEVEVAKKDRKLYLTAGQSGQIRLTATLTFQQMQRFQNAAINIYIKNKAGDKRLLVQKVTRIGHRFDQGIRRWKKMPLTLELTAQNVTTNYASYTASVNGELDLNGGKSLNIQMQANNFLNDRGKHTNIGNITYMVPLWQLSAGTFVDFDHFLIHGNGMRVRHLQKNNGYVEVLSVKGREERTKQIDLNISEPLSKGITFSNTSFMNLDAAKHTNSYLSVNGIKYTSGATTIGMEAGEGVETFTAVKNDTVTSGPMLGYQFESSHKKWTVASHTSFYSKNFPGLNKGFEFHNHELRYQLHNYFIGGFYQSNRKVFTDPHDSAFKILFNTDEKEYGVRNSFLHKTFSVNTSLSLLRQQQDSANSMVSRMWKLSVNSNWLVKPNLSFSLFTNIGYIKIKERPDIAPFFALTNFGSLQTKNFGLHLRYDAGAFYYFEIKEYIKAKYLYKHLQLSPFFQKQFNRPNLFLQAQLNFSYEQPLNYNYVLLTNQLVYSLPGMDMDLGLLSTLDLKNTRAPVINLVIRKRLLAPVYRNAQSYSFTVLLFKDKNGNGIFDAGESPIKMAMVVANGNWLLTGENGEIELRNMGKEIVSLDFSKIGNLTGWMPNGGFLQIVTPSKNSKKQYIPFKESKILSGALTLRADDKSNQKMSVSNIRITVSDGDGTQYNTLTDAQGAFHFNLPAGRYLVSVNENVFDDNFKPVEFSKPADLDHNDKIDVVFQIIQKKRQMNVTKSE